LNTIVRLLGFLRPHLGLFALALCGVIAMSALEAAKPLLIGIVIDRVIEGGEFDILLVMIAAILGANVLHAGTFYGTQYLRHYLGERVVYDIRNVLYQHIHYLDARFHDTARTGELMSRVTSDVHAIRRFAGDGLYLTARIVFRLVIVAGAALTLSWKLTLIEMSVAPMLYVTVRIFKRQVETAYLGFQQRMAKMAAVLQENITGVRVVRSFGQEKKEEAKFDAENMGVFERALDAAKVRAKHGPMIEFWTVLSRGILLLAGGWFVVNGEITIGTFVAFDGFLSRLMQPFRMLPNLLDMLGEGKASGARIFEILDTKPLIPAKGDERPLPEPQGRVTFENVTFNYRAVDEKRDAPTPAADAAGGERISAGFTSRAGGTIRVGSRSATKRALTAGRIRTLPALRSINLDVRPKETIAIFGATGSGKSTLMHLINRTYDPDEGRVLLDGVDLRDLPVQELRRKIAVVPQESFLFSATIYENIAYGKPDATMDEVIAAAKKAQAHEFITRLPAQYHTVIGERGAGLSGGQRQRLTIARAILLRPAILVIDDATSAVDTQTEHLIWQALGELIEECTTFIVAQRVSTARHADRIIVLDDGRIVEEGTHEELLRANGFYRRIYDMQTADVSEGIAHGPHRHTP